MALNPRPYGRKIIILYSLIYCSRTFYENTHLSYMVYKCVHVYKHYNIHSFYIYIIYHQLQLDSWESFITGNMPKTRVLIKISDWHSCKIIYSPFPRPSCYRRSCGSPGHRDASRPPVTSECILMPDPGLTPSGRIAQLGSVLHNLRPTSSAYSYQGPGELSRGKRTSSICPALFFSNGSKVCDLDWHGQWWPVCGVPRKLK